MQAFLGSTEIIVLGILTVVFVPLWLLPALMAYRALSKVPNQFRKQQPEMALLLLIPCFSMIWAFFVYPKISESIAAGFNSAAINGYGDCGRSLGITLAILGICSCIPYLGILAFVAYLAVFIIFFKRVFRLAELIPISTAV